MKKRIKRRKRDQLQKDKLLKALISFLKDLHQKIRVKELKCLFHDFNKIYWKVKEVSKSSLKAKLILKNHIVY